MRLKTVRHRGSWDPHMSSDHGRARVLRDLGLGDEDLAAWHAATLPEKRFEARLVDRRRRGPAVADGAFTALAMSAVFFFFADPTAVVVECRRVRRYLAERGETSRGRRSRANLLSNRC